MPFALCKKLDSVLKSLRKGTSSKTGAVGTTITYRGGGEGRRSRPVSIFVFLFAVE